MIQATSSQLEILNCIQKDAKFVKGWKMENLDGRVIKLKENTRSLDITLARLHSVFTWQHVSCAKPNMWAKLPEQCRRGTTATDRKSKLQLTAWGNIFKTMQSRWD